MCESEDLSDIEKILLKYIGLKLVKSKNTKLCLQGPVKIENKWFYIKLIFPNYPKLTDFTLQIQLSLIIKTYTSEKLNTDKNCTTIEELIDKLPTLVDLSSNIFEIRTQQEDGVCNNIHAEVAKLYSPHEYNTCLNEDCTLIQFTKFTQNENHFLKVALPSLKVMDHSLPSCVDWNELLEKSATLSALLHKFKSYLEDLRTFYDNFSNIDELCHVVQPTLPNTKANWRLFVLKEKVFLKLQFADPFSPLTSMSVNIIGPTSEVSQLRRVYSEGLRDWDLELDVHKNLLRIFDLCFFPMPSNESFQTSLQFCNICYCFKLENNEIPIVSCDNKHCSVIYHPFCLKAWFNTLTDGKTFLDVAFGTCPFCKTKLSTSFQEILS